MNDLKTKVQFFLLYDLKQGKTAAESHRSISNTFGKDVIKKSQYYNWFQLFRNGNKSLGNKERAGRAKTLDKDKLKEFLD